MTGDARPLKARWRAALDAGQVYRDRRVIAILLLGFASGLPLALTGATLTFWLAEAGIDKAAIGLFALVGIAYGWKFAWAPVIDRLPLPVLTRVLGRRRGWILLCQAALIAAILVLGTAHPAENLLATALLAVLVAFCSASQDIVIDAYRVEILEERQQGAGAAVIVIGYRIAMLVSGAGTLLIADQAGWLAAYAAMAALLLVGVATVLISPEPAASALIQPAARRTLGVRLREAVIEPFAEFLRRNGWRTALVILLFIMFYKLGDALLGVMANPFYVELGFSKTEVASVVKTFGLIATLGGGLAGGLLINARGILPALWICGIVQMLSNLMFAAQAMVGHSVPFLVLTIGLENLAGGMGTAAFVAYLSSLCNVRYTATQYALLTSFMAQTRTVLASSGGVLAESMDWASFFLLTTLSAAPALVLLFWLSRHAGAALPEAGAAAARAPLAAGRRMP
ncbi:MAG: AmpG family muropeptide MFS transporter [Geminicoccaceae bacterium]